MRILKNIIGAIFNTLKFIFTGGPFGSYVPSKYSYNYAKSQEKRDKDFEKYGGHDCKICGTRIPGNKYYCYPCYSQYKKK